MSAPAAHRRVAIIGNPNTGKSSVFNALTGLSQKVGNYPGVTVERKTGILAPGVELIDLPGMYSLAAHSPDELLAARVLLGDYEGEPEPDLVVVVADAGHLERNLYLAMQVVETGRPMILVLNMIDVAERAGVHVNTRGLSKLLGVPVLPTVAHRGLGIAELRDTILEADASPVRPRWEYPEPLEGERKDLAGRFDMNGFLLARALIDEGGPAERLLSSRADASFPAALAEARARIRASGSSPAAIEAAMRHRWIAETLAIYARRDESSRRLSERIDNVLLHRAFGIPVFLLVFSAVFVSIFMWAAPFMDLITRGFDALGSGVRALLSGTPLAGGALESLIVDGALAGVGGVLAFLPQIAFLFFFVAILDDCGYMARAAFLLDRIFRGIGLTGTSFIPLLSSFACAVPGILATRTIANARDRMTTVLMAPFVSCSARIPIYSLMIAAFLPSRMIGGFLPLQGIVFGAMYFVGILAAIATAIIARRTLLKGPPSTFVMELPPYKVPSPRAVALRIFDRCRTFVRQAGTIIFAMSIVVWALGYFPRSPEIARAFNGLRAEAGRALSGNELATRLKEIERDEAGAYVRDSYLGRTGRALEPAVRPLGWDWKIGMATIASFPAREVIVSTLNIIYDLGKETTDKHQRKALIEKLAADVRPDGRPVFTIPVAISVMVFFALCCQCGATLATIKRETNSWRWTLFTFCYMTLLAYAGSLAAYRIGTAVLG